MSSKQTTLEMPLRTAALIAGIGYLLVFLISILGNELALNKIIVEGDAIKTANNIIANQSLFRFGTTCWLIVVVLDAIVAWALYYFFKPTNDSLALLSAWSRIIFVAIFGYSFLNYFSALHLLSGAEYLEAIELSQLQAQSMHLIESHNYAMHYSFVFFGIHVLSLGYLILKSGYVPKLFGILLIVAACGYFINSFGNFLSSDYASNQTLFIIFVAIPAMISEFSFTLWLLIKGRKINDSKVELSLIENK